MSRVIIGAVVAVVITVLTGIAYFVTTSSLEDQVAKDARVRVERAAKQLVQNASLEGLGILKRVETMATEPKYVEALRSSSPRERGDIANLAFRRFLQAEAERATADKRQEGSKPDLIALTDKNGDIVAMLDVLNPVAGEWKNAAGELLYPGVKVAIENRIVTSDVWDYQGKGLMKVGVAPVLDHEDLDDRGEPKVLGSLVVAYSMTAVQAQEQQKLLGAFVAYFYGDKVSATSFRREAGEDTQMQTSLAPLLEKQDLGKLALEKGVAGVIVSVSLDQDYVVTAGRLQPFSSKPLPATYPAPAAGAMVLMSLSEQAAAHGKVKTFILLLGIASLVLALLAVHLSSRQILHQVDDIEVGVTEIINGNLEKTFPKVGVELDGLANALNVMLARLLGRPEPGEEEFDEDGNPVIPGKVDFDEQELGPADSAAMALANEPEPEYYTRLFNEYVRARESTGTPAKDLSFDSFIAKLRVNEGKLKALHQCKAVRFRVVVAEGKVTLKPVPIV